jgi:1,2-diacylglycerol 3-beta-glucosyltransferase
MSELLLGLVNTAAFMLCVGFVAYVTMIIVPYLKHRPEPPGDGGSLGWHFVLPCLDEEAVITSTVEQLVSTFPHAEVWCVDDASGDATPVLLAALADRHDHVHVVTRRAPEARKGKGPALNAGWQAIVDWLPEGTDAGQLVVGVLDADARLQPGALDAIAGAAYFGSPGVGAVQVQVRVHHRAERRRPSLLLRLQDLEFSGPIAAMQLLRQRSGSVGMGGNGQFTRLSVLNQIAGTAGTPWHGALLEDFELGLHVLLAGERTEYCHETWVEQDGLPGLRPLIRQRSRWAQGAMQCLRYLTAVMRSPRISTPAAVEIAYFLMMPWLQLAGSVVYTVAGLVMGYYATTQPGGLRAWFDGGAWGVVPLVAVFGLTPFLVWGPIYRRRSDPSLGLGRALALGVANWLYSYLNYAAVWWAFVRMVRGRHDWKKTAHAGTAVAPVPSGDADLRPTPALT